MNSFDLALLRILAKCAEQNRVKSYNDVTGSVAKPDNNKCPCDMACEGELGTACYMCNAGTVSAGLFPLLYNSCWCQSRSEIPWSSAPEHHTQPGNKALVWLPRLPCSCFTGWNETPCRVRIMPAMLHPNTGRESYTAGFKHSPRQGDFNLMPVKVSILFSNAPNPSFESPWQSNLCSLDCPSYICSR